MAVPADQDALASLGTKLLQPLPNGAVDRELLRGGVDVMKLQSTLEAVVSADETTATRFGD
jgi:hypothetical protein